MKNDTLDKLVWALIYAGLFLGGLGIWYAEHSLAVGWTLALVGGAMIAVAAFLIWVRSRRTE
jgi:hypothetical protein